MKPRTKNRSRESERLKRKQLLPLKYRYSERRKRVYVAASIKIPAASNRTRHLWPPSCLLLRARACEKTWVQEKPSTNQTKVSFVYGESYWNLNWPIRIQRAGKTVLSLCYSTSRQLFTFGLVRSVDISLLLWLSWPSLLWTHRDRNDALFWQSICQSSLWIGLACD